MALFLFLFFLLLVIKENILFAPFQWDAMGYIGRSTSAFYETGQLLSLTGKSGHPPLFFVGLATFWKIFGRSLISSHIFILFFGSLSLTFVFALAQKLYGIKEAVAATLLLLSNQIFFAQVGTVQLSVPITCLAILTVHLYLRQRYLLYGLAAAAMLLVKETTVIILAAIILYDFFQNIFNREAFVKKAKRILLLSLPAVPLMIWQFYHWRMSGWFVNTSLFVNKARFLDLFLDNSIRYLIYDKSVENVNKAYGILFLAVSAFIVCQIIARKSLRKEVLFLMIIIMNIILFAYTDDLPRYFLVIYPFYFILGARSFVFLSELVRVKNFLWVFLLASVMILSVMNFSGHRSTDGWRLESNMEYLDFVKVCQKACQYLEKEYPEKKILAIFPMLEALKNPWYGYVKKPFSVIPYEEIHKHEDFMLVRTYQANDLFLRKHLHIDRSEFELIKEFSVKSKKVMIYRKKSKR